MTALSSDVQLRGEYPGNARPGDNSKMIKEDIKDTAKDIVSLNWLPQTKDEWLNFAKSLYVAILDQIGEGKAGYVEDTANSVITATKMGQEMSYQREQTSGNPDAAHYISTGEIPSVLNPKSGTRLNFNDPRVREMIEKSITADNEDVAPSDTGSEETNGVVESTSINNQQSSESDHTDSDITADTQPGNSNSNSGMETIIHIDPSSGKSWTEQVPIPEDQNGGGPLETAYDESHGPVIHFGPGLSSATIDYGDLPKPIDAVIFNEPIKDNTGDQGKTATHKTATHKTAAAKAAFFKTAFVQIDNLQTDTSQTSPYGDSGGCSYS